MPVWAEQYLSASNPFFYPVIFVLLLMAGTGFPVSADLVLLTCGYLAYTGKADLAVLFPVCIIGILVSDSIMFQIGRRFGTRLLGVWPFRKALPPARIDQARAVFQVHGYKVVFAARFMPGIRTVFIFTSGLMKLRFWKTIACDAAGAVIVVPVTILSVTWVAGNMDAIFPVFRKAQWVILGAVLAFVVYRLATRRSRRAAKAQITGS